MKKKSNYYRTRQFLSLFGITDLLRIISLIIIVGNALVAFFKYDSERFDGMITGVGVMTAIALLIFPVCIASVFISHYTFMTTLPVKTSKIPDIFMKTMDSQFAIIILADAVVMFLTGFERQIVIKALIYLVFYIMSYIFLYVSVTPGATKDTNIKRGIIGGVLGFTGYLAGIAASAALTMIIEDNRVYTSKQLTIILIIFSVIMLCAILTRLLVGRGVRTKIRLMKVYKTRSKKKAQKEESYV